MVGQMSKIVPPGTSAGGFAFGGNRGAAPEGQYTATIYGMIRDGLYADAIRVLSLELQNFPRSRAALSLLGYCYYMVQDFRSAAQAYEELVKYFPEGEAEPRDRGCVGDVGDGVRMVGIVGDVGG